MTETMKAIQKARALLAAATSEVRSWNEDGTWRDSHEVGEEVLARLAACEQIAQSAKVALAVDCDMAEALTSLRRKTWRSKETDEMVCAECGPLSEDGQHLSACSVPIVEPALTAWEKLWEGRG